MAQTAALLRTDVVVGNTIDSPYGNFVKITSKPHPGDNSTDLIVWKRPSPAFAWQEVDRFNDVEDKRAHYNAHALAMELRQAHELAADFTQPRSNE